MHATTADSIIKKGVVNVLPITIVNKLVGFQDAPLDFLLQGAFDSTAVTGGAVNESELVEIGLRAFEVVLQQLLQKTRRISLDSRYKPERVASLQVRRFAKLHVRLE